MKDKIKYRRQGQGRRPSPESRKQHSSGHGYSRSQERHDGEQRQLHPFSKANKLYGQVG